MLLSTQSVNVAMLMATYGVAGGFGMGLVYLESVSNLNPVIDQTAKKKLSLNRLDSCHEESFQRFLSFKAVGLRRRVLLREETRSRDRVRNSALFSDEADGT